MLVKGATVQLGLINLYIDRNGVLKARYYFVVFFFSRRGGGRQGDNNTFYNNATHAFPYWDGDGETACDTLVSRCFRFK